MPSRITRRAFLVNASRIAAAAAVSGTPFFSQGCDPERRLDLIIRGAAVYDGTGRPGYPADIGITGGRIQVIGKIEDGAAKRTIDAGGLAASPGFIDVHQHSDVGLLVNPLAESTIRQGVTTVVGGNCGDSVFPMSDEMMAKEKKSLREDFDLELTWRDGRGFFRRLEDQGVAVNYASLVGLGTVRAAVVGYGNRRATPAELKRMELLVRESLTAGAVGVSTGLEYTPGSFADEAELVAMCRGAARLGGVYATHMRDEEEGVLEAVDEAVRIARAAGVKLQISHLKIGYARNWPKFDELVRRIEAAAASGLDVFCDRYPYTAWSTGLSSFFPLWAREGTTRDFLARLRDPALEARLRSEVGAKEELLGGWDKVLISSVATEKNKPAEGRDVLTLAKETGKDAFTYLRDLLLDEEGRVGQITFAMSEDNLERLLAHPLVGVGSDGSAVAPYGPLAEGNPHPRLYGTFPRVLGKYVREEKVTTLEDMVRKMTAVPASRFGFAGRGLLASGRWADVVLFDPERVADRATWKDPEQYPLGIEYVIVNGQVVVERGEHTGRRPGRVLRLGKDGRAE
ncbi:MAG: D-aminoacylase [Candidatus Aminicenantes bacterium]|nr:D-aminoacylase [Candidatus Aminicenantes bacterium]